VKYVYFFNKGESEGNASMKEILGGKGANLAEMANMGIPVPPGFTISTEVCRYYNGYDGIYPDSLKDEVEEHLRKLEKATGKRFGDRSNPLLVSVRSGAAVSMPGMMDTVLNLGLTDETVQGVIAKAGNERFAYDSYRRLVQMYGDVVLGLKPQNETDVDPFEEILEKMKEERGVKLDTELDAADLKALVASFKAAIKDRLGIEFPQDPMEQLWGAITAVFHSWTNPRAITYRELNDIHDLIGTAVNVQAMVFGNMGAGCGTGVAFTRDPSTGENAFYGEYLMNAQGEDVVAGIRTPLPIATLRDELPKIYDELLAIRAQLEDRYRDMQDIEFTIENGTLYMLQTRTGKRTAFSWLRSQVEMVEEGMIDKEEAVKRVPASEFSKLFAPILDQADIEAKELTPITQGLNASPGGACGQVVFTADETEKWAADKAKERAADEAEERAADDKDVILVRIETSPEDIGGMSVANGILTARGGMTSHAAVVARGMGCPCIAGAGDLQINYGAKQMIIKGEVIKQGDIISIDGFTGNVYNAKIPVKPSEIVQVMNGEMAAEDSLLYRNYSTFMAWVDGFRTLGVRTNADTPHDAATAVKFGAEGIGLCRTEHMFFEEERIIAVREMILANYEEEGRRTALAKLLPMQREDFEGIFKAMEGRPVTVRLLDPPLHEFLPHDPEGQEEVAEAMGVPLETIKKKVDALHEVNPMLGHRGCRLGITYPEISEMQARAIMEAACNVYSEGTNVHPEIMIPLVGNVKELSLQRKLVEKTAKAVLTERNLTKEQIPYTIGTMIEVPRAALTADEIAQEAGGFSRDDAAKFLKEYVAKGIYAHNPFEVLDQRGIGKLVQMACELGREARPEIKLGICGEHGGEPSSIHFCHKVGLHYVSCSPYRIPVARLAAAQAALDDKQEQNQT
jgi:pyruvate,orthophosphate dikinase